ncbi:MAG: dihydropteroate synthase [Planctomycetota bacterium]
MLRAQRLRVLGILNVTPDSFSDGGHYLDVRAAVTHAHDLRAAGADAIDIGGESTRPGAAEISVDEELARVVPVLDELRRDGLPISIDTRRHEVARAAADRGATMLNDTAALRDDSRLAVLAAERELTVVLMHRQGRPLTMQVAPRYTDLLNDVRGFFAERVAAALAAGIRRDRLVLDPGLGFGKSREDNYRLMAHLDYLAVEDLPMMVGASRKSFLRQPPFAVPRGNDGDGAPPSERLPASLAFVAAAYVLGASWVRVHDVAATVRLIETLSAIALSRAEELR